MPSHFCRTFMNCIVPLSPPFRGKVWVRRDIGKGS